MNRARDSIRVLHVDDQPEFAELVASFLEREDDRIVVETAPGAIEGLDRLDSGEFDCVVSDYDMAGRNGIEFLEDVRREYPDLPFVLFTGKGSEEVASRAISAGVTDYLQKAGGTDQYTILANRVTNAVERFRIERRANRTRTQLQAVLDNSADVIVTIDENNRIRLANPAVEEYFGYTPAELEGERLATILAGRFHEGGLAALDRCVETSDRTTDWSNADVRGQHRDGTEVPLSVSFGEFDGDGERRFIGIMRDVSDRSRLEAELREREERFRQVAEHVRGVVWLADPNEEEFRYVNPAYEELWGRPVETLYDDPTTFLDAVHPDDRERLDGTLGPGATEAYDEEYRIVRPDGDRRWVRDRAVPVWNDAGELDRVVGFVSDVTERNERTRRLETLVDNLPGIVYRCRNAPDWPMQSVNGECEALTGYPAEAIERHDVAWGVDVVHPADQDRVWAAVQERIEGGDEFELTYRIRTADGTTRWVWERGRLVESRHDGEEVLEGFVTDVTERKEHEERLRETTARLEALFDSSPDMINVHDAEGEIIDPNPRLCEETGYDEAELTDMKVWDLDRSIDPEEAVAVWEDMESGDRRELDGVYQRRDGSTFPAEVHVRRLDLNGRERFVVISRNVSERRARERELEEYEAIVEKGDDGIYVFDEAGRFRFVNQRVADVSGIQRDAWIGEHVSMLADLGTLAERDTASIEEAIEAIARGDADEVSVELTPTVPHDLEVLELRLTSFRTESGSDRVIAFSRDVTDRKRREHTLRELQRRTEELIRASTPEEIADIAVATARDTLGHRLSGVHLVDDEGDTLRPIAVSDEVREHLGRAPAYDRTDPARSTDTVNWNIFERGETVVIDDIREHEWIPASETPSLSGIVQPLGDHGLFITSSPEPHAFDDTDVALTEILATIVTAALDRTERETTLRARTRRLEAKTERLEEFAGIVSHDLRNPLTVAEGRLELAREEGVDSDQLDAVERAHTRMRELIDDLLALAREGRPVEAVERVSLADTGRACWRHVETGTATLVTATDHTIRADPSRVRQLLENLIRNAVEHGGEDVTVRIGALDGRRGFFVADDGPGVPPDEREAVFESGYSTSDAGTGFGLAIANEIAEAHGWTIDVTGSEDGGARFEITGVTFVDD
jgi:PAS domain S-box-containing protein